MILQTITNKAGGRMYFVMRDDCGVACDSNHSKNNNKNAIGLYLTLHDKK